MKPTKVILLMFLMILTRQAFGTIIGYEFDWVPSNGQSQYDASIVYSGGTTVNGIFTPSGITTYSIGSPFGFITPKTPGFGFIADTSFGPSFHVQGVVQPIDDPGNPVNPGYQVFIGNNLAIYFQGQTEIINYFDTKQEPNINLSGTWSETILPVPETSSSLVLLAVALGGLGLFHAARRGRARAGS